MSCRVEFLVDTPNPSGLDSIIIQIGGVLLGGPNYVRRKGHYVVCILGRDEDEAIARAKLLRYSIISQGYAVVLEEPIYVV